MAQHNGLTKPAANHALAGLDHLRALAITLVLIFHYSIFEHPHWVESAGSFGWTGVDLFFVLSGYLISSQLFDKVVKGQHISMAEFYIKRSFRILPAYYVLLLLYFFVPPFREGGAPAPLWKLLTFTENFGLDTRVTHTFTHGWSLCVEEQFYLLLPLLLLSTYVFKAGRKAFLIVPALFVAGFAIRLLIWKYAIIPAQNHDGFGSYWTEMMYYPTYTRLDGLLVGVTIAALTKFAPVFANRVMRYGNILLASSLLLLVASYFVVAERTSFMASIFGFPLVSVAYGVLVLAAISPNCVLYKYRSALTANIATLSYSIYLTHKGVIHLTHAGFGKLGIAPDGNLMIVISILFAVLAAIIMRQVVEKPFLRLRDKVLQKRNAKLALAIKTAVVEQTVY